ncbi:MAG: TlpA family protein disulfide reductase, partial [Gammaproteobacteria bacterium]
AYAAQKDTKEALQNDPRNIYGKVTEVISTAGYTYAEVDTGKEKVWAVAPVITPLEKGDMVAFSTEMPMKNFHSKTIERDFSIIYFIKNYITDKETSTIASSHDQAKQQQIVKPITTTAAAVGTPGEVKVGDYLREATLDGLNVGTKKFSDFKGKPLIINVWASWCGPCRAEMGSLERLAQRYNGKAFNVIGISTDDYRNKAETFIKKTEITFENFLDNKLLLENMLGANTIPLTILVDADGRVLEKVRGSREWDSSKTIDAIGQVLNIKLMP